jgi:hypothetical protein
MYENCIKIIINSENVFTILYFIFRNCYYSRGPCVHNLKTKHKYVKIVPLFHMGMNLVSCPKGKLTLRQMLIA